MKNIALPLLAGASILGMVFVRLTTLGFYACVPVTASYRNSLTLFRLLDVFVLRLSPRFV